MKLKIQKFLPLFICIIFFIAYSFLSIIKHNHFLSGYDLAVADQAVWKYSLFHDPISTAHAYYNTPIYYDHFELIYAVISPFFWIIPDVRVLILLQNLAVVISGLVVFMLAKRLKIIFPIAVSLLISFLAFYGIQNAIWSDVHSTVLAIPFLALLIYLLQEKKYKIAIIPFVLAIICKEDMALFTFLIGAVYFYKSRDKTLLYFMAASVLYLIFVFFIFYPHLTPGYRFQNSHGLLSNISINNFVNTQEKREAIFYSALSYGFIPILAPIYLILAFFDLAHYFVLGSDYVSSAQGLFLHYRSTLALFLSWPTIIAISRIKKLNKIYIAMYLIVCLMIVQYLLHLPLSYLTKQWFWQTPAAVADIQTAINQLPKNASVATQVNIAPHITHRDKIYLLWPNTQDFKQNSPCNKPTCRWFRIGNKVDYVLVDTSNSWDARHFLESREDFIEGIQNLEKAKVIKPIYKHNTTTLYKLEGNL